VGISYFLGRNILLRSENKRKTDKEELGKGK
jgi:hypothetical protein